MLAASSPSKRNEPMMIMTLEFGKGRVFPTPMGHADYSMRCSQAPRSGAGAEWAATGKVTVPIPDNFGGKQR
ncbi:MAG: hypothetical protein R3F11_27170 [Verrucomicrobiales bacterium]